MSNHWDPALHPRDLNNGEFTESWAQRIADLAGQHAARPPWETGRHEHKDAYQAAWVEEAARTFNNLGYNTADLPTAGPGGTGGAGGTYRFSTESLATIYNQHAYRYHPRDYIMDTVAVLEFDDTHVAGARQLRNARSVYRAAGDNPSGDGKQIKGHRLVQHPDFATSGDFQILAPDPGDRYSADWLPLEEMHYDPDSEQIEFQADDRVWTVDAGEDIEIRSTWRPQFWNNELGWR